MPWQNCLQSPLKSNEQHDIHSLFLLLFLNKVAEFVLFTGLCFWLQDAVPCCLLKIIPIQSHQPREKYDKFILYKYLNIKRYKCGLLCTWIRKPPWQHYAPSSQVISHQWHSFLDRVLMRGRTDELKKWGWDDLFTRQLFLLKDSL